MAMKELKLSLGEEFFGLPIAEWLAMWTVPKAAKILGMTPQAVHQLIERDLLLGARLLDNEGDLIKVVVSKKSVDEYQTYRANKAKLVRPAWV